MQAYQSREVDIEESKVGATNVIVSICREPKLLCK